MLLECAHFIHRCNRGDWPSWMKHNLPSFRHNVNALQNRGQPSGYRRNLLIQRMAGRLFYTWAEVMSVFSPLNRNVFEKNFIKSVVWGPPTFH